MFYDSSYHTIDAKNRVFVPKRFLPELGRGSEGDVVCYLTLGFEGCLFLFSETGFESALERLNVEAFAGSEARKMQRLFFSNTQKTALDASGRLLIPDKLKSRIGIDKEIVMVGVADRAEIWPKERWDEFQASNEADYDLLDRVLCSESSRARTNGSKEPS